MSSLRSHRRFSGGRLNRTGVRATLLLAGSAFVLDRTLSSPTAGDYAVHAPVSGDNAGPAIDALVHGHLQSLISHQPLMGLTSILLRLPFVGAAALMGTSEHLAYAVGAFACLLPMLLLATWLMTRQRASIAQLAVGAIAATLLLAGAATTEAVSVGHPEELLAAVLATAAVLAASSGRRTWAWVLLGLAIGTKQWALLALPCVIVALPDRRLAVAAKACALALALTAALPLADPDAFARANSIGAGHLTGPLSLWWPLGSRLAPAHLGTLAPVVHVLPLGLTRSSAAALALGALLCGLSVYGLRRRGHGVDALALLALVGLARCVTDPLPLQYYFVALFIPLAVWEAVELGRLPLATALAMASVGVLAKGSVASLGGAQVQMSPAIVSVLSTAWAVLLGCYLSYRVFNARVDRKVVNFGFPTSASIGEES